MVNKNTVDYYPNPYHLVSRMHTLIFLYTPEGFISPEYFLDFFPKPAYSTLVAKKFQIYSVKITANIFVSQKIESVHFNSCPWAKFSPKFLLLSPRQTGIAHSSRTAFFEDIFSWGERRRGLWSWKNTKINKGVSHKFW